jgi:hypothetical protein
VTKDELLSALDQALADDNPDDGVAFAVMAHVARLIGLLDAASAWVERADLEVLNTRPGPGNDHVLKLLDGCVPFTDDERFLVIRAWGFGFYADAMHVLGGLMLAEFTGRMPCVLWGRNSLFLPSGKENAFPFFFNAIGSEFQPFVATAPSDRIFPGKCGPRDIAGAAFEPYCAPRSGGEGKMAAIRPLNRPERIVVSDFFIGVADLLSWIPKGHRWHGQSLDQIVQA